MDSRTRAVNASSADQVPGLHSGRIAVASSFLGAASENFHEAGQSLDYLLWLVSRIFAAILVVALLLGCVLALTLKNRFGSMKGRSASRPLRPHHVKEILYKYLCCGACCTCCDSLCRPGVEKLLRVTLVCATKVQKKTDFYVEVWCEPSEGHPKGSRVHRQACGSVDLGYERIELDWYGDEKEVVLQVMQYNGSSQIRDVPIGELRISGESVERYALEAAASAEADVRKGSRMFTVRRLARAEAVRKNRFKDMLFPDGVLPAVFARLGEDQGIELPQMQDMARLQAENEALMQENTQLRTHISQSGGGSSWSSSWRPQRASEDGGLMGVAVRFEILPRARAVLKEPELIHAPSQEDVGLLSTRRSGFGGA